VRIAPVADDDASEGELELVSSNEDFVQLQISFCFFFAFSRFARARQGISQRKFRKFRPKQSQIE
jgi:hypothetical protein